jgi:hypothetical protein
MNTETKTVICILCNEPHETFSMYGMVYVPCPEMPKDIIVPSSAIEAFMTGRSMLDQPFIVIT